LKKNFFGKLTQFLKKLEKNVAGTQIFRS